MTETYEKILNTAYKSFATLGYEKASLSQIAKKVGISKPALYYYFSSKENLFETLYDEIIKEIINSYNEDFSTWTKEDYKDKLIEIGRKDIDHLEKDVDLGLILKQYYLLGIRNNKLNEKTSYLNEQTLNYYKSIIKKGIELGIVNDDECESLSRLIHMTISSISLESIMNPEYDYYTIWKYFVNKILI